VNEAKLVGHFLRGRPRPTCRWCNNNAFDETLEHVVEECPRLASARANAFTGTPSVKEPLPQLAEMCTFLASAVEALTASSEQRV
jgi:hypothetical protein